MAAALGVPAALYLSRARGTAAQLTMTLLLSPLAMPLVVLGFALLFYLSALGLGVSFLALLIAHSVVSLPYIVRTVAAQYRGLPPSREEAALVLGASRWQVFRHITLPLIRPGIFAGCLLSVLISIDNLPVSYFFGSARTNTLPVVMLSYLQNQFDPSIAAVSTIQLVLAILALGTVQLLTGRRRAGRPSSPDRCNCRVLSRADRFCRFRDDLEHEYHSVLFYSRRPDP